MTEVRPRENESTEAMIKRFTKSVIASGILQDVKLKQHFIKPSEKKRKEKVAQASRNKKRMKKEAAIAKRENENKFKPRTNSYRDRNKDNRGSQDNTQNRYDRPDKRNYSKDRPQARPVPPKVVKKEKPVSTDDLKKLQEKFNK